MTTDLPQPIIDYLTDPLAALQGLLRQLGRIGATSGPAVAVVLGLAITTGVVTLRWRRRRIQREWDSDSRLVTILLPPTVDPAGAVTWWSNVVGLLRPGWKRRLLGQPHLAMEYLFTSDGLSIGIWVPGVVPPGMVERAVEAAWPGAHTATSPSPAANWTDTVAVGGELRLARNEALPIRTHFTVDPMRPLLGAVVSLGPHETCRVQVLARPVAGRRVRRARRRAHRLHSGKDARHKQSVLELAARDRAVVEKLRGPLFEVRVRYLIASRVDETQRTAAREVLRGRGHAVASAFATFSEHNFFARRRLRSPSRVVGERELVRGDLMSIAELAAVAHLPLDQAAPGVQRAGARAVPPPPGVADVGDSVRPLGRTNSGLARPVGLRVADARHHLHILGATGSGKSELMARMILADVDQERGVLVLDPKGDLVNDVLMRLPEHLGPKVVLFDADSRHHPPVLNPLEGDDHARVVDNLVSIFSRVYASSWGPRTDDVLRAGLLTLTAVPGTPTIDQLPRLLTDPAWRETATRTLKDPVLRGFWTWYDSLSPVGRAQVIAPLMNKVRGFLLRPFVRHAIAGGRSTFSMDDVLDGRICLVRLARDALGAETSQLVGSIVVASAWQAATRRARVPESKRRDCGIYIDEFHNFLKLPYTPSDMLAEARAYHCSFTLAHQYIRQLPPELEEGVSANARTKVIFNASPEDARRLARHTEPRLTEHDLANLGRFEVALRLVLHGAEIPAFTAVTEQLPPAKPGRARRVRQAARVNTVPPPEPAANVEAKRAADPRRAA